MRILKINTAHKYNLVAELECEFCGAFSNMKGDNSIDFWRSVFPYIECVKCGVASNELGGEDRED